MARYLKEQGYDNSFTGDFRPDCVLAGVVGCPGRGCRGEGPVRLRRTIQCARLGAGKAAGSQKPNLWVAEPCNRDWEADSANCYFYAKGKHWKAVSGLHYGDDPDFWPVFIAHGPAGGGTVSAWDFTAAVKFWFDGRHANHGFFLYGDSNDYMRMYTPRAKDIRLRPAMMVIYEPK